MSVLIKGMEIPTSCCDCPIGDSLCCSLMPGVPALWKEYTISIRTNRRHSQCPLLPVPQHGRLIDADALMQRIEHDTPLSDVFEKTMRWYLHNAPTIIPAEEVYGQFTDTAGNLHWTGTHSGEHIIQAEEGE